MLTWIKAWIQTIGYWVGNSLQYTSTHPIKTLYLLTLQVALYLLTLLVALYLLSLLVALYLLTLQVALYLLTLQVTLYLLTLQVTLYLLTLQVALYLLTLQVTLYLLTLQEHCPVFLSQLGLKPFSSVQCPGQGPHTGEPHHFCGHDSCTFSQYSPDWNFPHSHSYVPPAGWRQNSWFWHGLKLVHMFSQFGPNVPGKRNNWV